MDVSKFILDMTILCEVEKRITIKRIKQAKLTKFETQFDEDYKKGTLPEVQRIIISKLKHGVPLNLKEIQYEKQFRV